MGPKYVGVEKIGLKCGVGKKGTTYGRWTTRKTSSGRKKEGTHKLGRWEIE